MIAVTAAGTKRARAASTCGSAIRTGKTLEYVAAVADPSMSTGFAVLASTGKQLAEAVDDLVSELGQQQAGRVAGVGGEDPEAAGVRQDGDPAAGRLWVGREEGRDVNQLFEQAARMTPAWWKSASTAPSEPASAAVCELAAR